MEAIKSSLKLVMASIAVTLLSNILPNKLLALIGIGLFIASGIALILVDAAIARREFRTHFPNPGQIPEAFDEDQNVSKEELMVESILTKILDHCTAKGVNATFMQQQDGLWLVKVNDTTGEFDKIMNLAMPNAEDLTPENKKEIEAKLIEEIDTVLNQLDSEKK